MTANTPPLKRSPQLASLSREHHDGLLFVWKLKQGVGNGTSLDVLKNFTLWHWRQHLAPHFAQEEKILLPYIDNSQLAEQLMKEHNDIRELILSIDADTERATFSILGRFIENHIRFEERQLFGYLQENLPGKQMEAIGSALEEHTVSCEEWPVEFWVRKK
jgi:hemerythrin-like domain-containing protein